MNEYRVKIIAQVIALVITSVFIPLYYDIIIESHNEEINEIDVDVNLHLHEFLRFRVWEQNFYGFQSSYNVLMALSELNETNIPDSLVIYYKTLRDTQEEAIITKMEILTDSGGDNLSIDEMEEKFFSNLNDKIDDKTDVKKELNSYKKIRSGFLYFSAFLQTGVIILTKKKGD